MVLMGETAGCLRWLGVILPLLPFLFTLSLAASSWQHEIYVDSENGVDNKSCWSGGWLSPCAGLNMALKGAQQYSLSTVLFIQPGNYSLQNGSETYFSNATQVAVIGNTSESSEILICCLSLAGLNFTHSRDLTFYSLTFIGCGFMADNGISAVLYFASCKNVNMSNVAFVNSYGNAIVFERMAGNVLVTESRYICNSTQYQCQGVLLVTDEERFSANYTLINNVFSGNNVSVANPDYSISFCSSPDSYPNTGVGAGLSIVIKGAAKGNQILILNTTLANNTANFGGGLLIALCDNAAENKVIIEGTDFTMNYASKAKMNYQKSGNGGGALVVFENMVGNMNSVVFTGCRFTCNSATHGGGMAVVLQSPPSAVNSCILSSARIHGCTFSRNKAYHGSALYLHRISSNHDGGLGVLLSNVEINNNVPADDYAASTGVVYSYHSSLRLSGSVSFIENQDTVLYVTGSRAVAFDNATIAIENNTLSYGRLVVMECSVLTLGEHTAVKLTGNNDVSVVLFSVCSSDVEESGSECFLQYTNKSLHPDYWKAEVSFSTNSGCAPNENNWNCNHNSAQSLPALIFDANILSCVWPANNSNILSSVDLDSIFKWKPFEYVGGHYPKMIMSGPTEMMLSREKLNFTVGEIMYSPFESYDYLGQTISKEVTLRLCIITNGIYFTMLPPATGTFPCWYAMSAADTTQVALRSENDGCFTDNIVEFILEVVTVGTSELALRVPTTLYHSTVCDAPLQCSPSSLTLCCPWEGHLCLMHFFDNQSLSPGICNDNYNVKTFYVSDHFQMQRGCCFWANAESSELIFGSCPPFNSQHDNRPDGDEMSVEVVCSDHDEDVSYPCAYNRTGKMCGQCEANRTVAINSFVLECINCDNQYGWLMFIGIQIVPLTIFLLLLMFFGVSLNYLSTNSYILFSQMVSLWFPGMSYPSWFLVFEDTKFCSFVLPYSIWSLDFLLSSSFYPFCLFPGMTTIQVIAFQYISAVYPLLVILFTFAWLEMYSRGVRLVFYITRPMLHLLARLSQRINIKQSLPDTFAVMYVLSSTQLARVSALLLTPTTLAIYNTTTSKSRYEAAFYYDASLPYFGEGHLFYGILAIVVLAVLVIAPTVLLLLYPFRFFQWLLSLARLNRPSIAAVVDAFSGSLRNGSTVDGIDARFFAGVLLIFRIFFVSLYSIPLGTDQSMKDIILVIECGVSMTLAGLILLVRPYRINCTNITDFFIFINLGLGALISVFISIFSSLVSMFANIPSPVAIIMVLLLYLPCFGLACFLLYLIWRKLIKDCLRRNTATVTKDEEDGDEAERAPLLDQVENNNCLFADRVLNPENYNEGHH